MESKTEIPQIKASDSGYSNSCSNSNSQRSSKSRLSGSNSSGSSGYCGVSNSGNGSSPTADQHTQLINRTKDREHKKKKLKSTANITSTTLPENPTTDDSSDITMGVPKLPMLAFEAQESTKQILSTSKTTTTVTDLTAYVQKIEEPSSLNELITSSPNEDKPDEDQKNETAKNNTEESHNGHSIDSLNNINLCQPEGGFCCVISMYDGVILYTTPSLTNILGFPKDMWLGRSFTDFIHPKDRETFSTQISTGIAVPLMDDMGKKREVKTSFYVCLRKYRGLKTSGYGVVEKAVPYQAFHLSVTFKNISEQVNPISLDNKDTFLVIVAVPISSTYKIPDEVQKSKRFGMRHSASCIFNHVDADVIMNFGYLPQDMLGKSVFDFYHPEDMPFLKEVYESVITECHVAGAVYKSKPYRFAVRNGDFVTIETEWSCFIDPWSKKLEFVLGLYRVLQGPTNPDVFECPKSNNPSHISDEVLKEAQSIREEILVLLNKEFLRPLEVSKQEVSKRCKDLAVFMESLIDEVSKSSAKLESYKTHDVSVSERNSVMLGEISPHHDYYDRDSSSETPPSYNQLNYNENIQRFFKSKQITTVSDESGERPSAVQSTTDTDQERKILSAVQACNQKCLSPEQNSGDSGSGSGGNLSSGSNPNMESGNTSSNGSYQPNHLTEELLLKHNEDMEKIMRQRYREYRSNIKADREGKKSINKVDKNLAENNFHKPEPKVFLHGLKRSGSHSWEGDNHKVSKHKHQTTNGSEDVAPKSSGVQNLTSENRAAASSGNNCNDSCYTSKMNDVNLWPPFSVSMTPINNTQPQTAGGNKIGNFPAGMFPVYYFPTATTQQTPSYGDRNGCPSHFQVQYMPGLMCNYNPAFSATPIFCPPMAMVPFSVPQPMPTLIPEGQQQISSTGGIAAGDNKMASPSGKFVPKFQRPESQATSVKAEPGSAIGSVASASGVNRAMSECSRKDLGLPSVCSPDTLVVSPPDCGGHLENCSHFTINKAAELSSEIKSAMCQDEESSYSSFYSSFLKTDTGSGSNDDSIGVENKTKSANSNATYKRPPSYLIKKCDPPWMEAVAITPELVYRYQMTMKNLDDILESDLKSLKGANQPLMVNDQLDQLYIEMELEGLSTKLTLEEGITSSSSSGEETVFTCSNKTKKKRRSYSSLMMIYEENAPFPPPEV